MFIGVWQCTGNTAGPLIKADFYDVLRDARLSPEAVAIGSTLREFVRGFNLTGNLCSRHNDMYENARRELLRHTALQPMADDAEGGYLLPGDADGDADGDAPAAAAASARGARQMRTRALTRAGANSSAAALPAVYERMSR